MVVSTWLQPIEPNWRSKGSVAKPSENTDITHAAYRVAIALGLGEKTRVWQLPLRDGEALRLLFDPPAKIAEESKNDLGDALSDAFDGLDVMLTASEPVAGVMVRDGALLATCSVPTAPPALPDAFDLLGVSRREDSYTTLVGRAFMCDAGFRSALLRVLGSSATTSADWACRLRVGVTAEADAKSVPDIVIFSRDAREMLIIEAKIDAGEGDRQTERYTDPDTRAKLCARLLGLDAPTTHQRGFFLTLDGAAPRSSWFNRLKWTAVAEAAEASTHPGTLGVLLRELAARVRQHDAWPAPGTMTPVLRYLRRRPGLVNEAAVFRRLLEESWMEAEGFKAHFGSTANPGCGNIPLCKWSKRTWERYKSASDPGLSIHFELQWNTASDDLDLYLHCETHPYLTKADMKEQHGSAALARHAWIQDDLFTKLEQQRKRIEAAGWRFRRGYNMLAGYKFPRFIRAGDFRARHRDLVGIMATAIDGWVTSTTRQR